jgi:glycosyltransferase involved in cell wall biosynthesis
MAAPTVCFIARTDFESKSGGDTIQWRMYDRAAREAGLQATTWFDDSPVPAADMFHAFNIDRPLELYPKLMRVKQLGMPFVLSPIHHPKQWIVRFRRVQPPTGFLGKLLYRSPIGRSVPASEAVREAVILVGQRRLTHLGDLVPRWSKRVQWLLANADRIALLTQQEAAYIRQDFAYEVRPAQALVLPNWVEGAGAASTEKPELFNELPEAPVLVVGRIEPRKNVLRICRLAEVAQRHVVFVGRPHPSEHAFAKAFRQAVLGSRYCRWVPGVPRQEMARFYSHSSFLLNASLAEVSPLVDIEALAFGCPIVTTTYAMHHALLPSNTPLCDPYDNQDILEWLGWRPDRLEPKHMVDPQECQRDLVQTYVALAQSRTSSPDGGRGCPLQQRVLAPPPRISDLDLSAGWDTCAPYG